MENVLFYGFSTIASTFGSAVGLIVAAAIFRMQKLDQIGSNLFDLLCEYLPDDRRVRMRRVRSVHDWKKHREVWKEAWENHEKQPKREDKKDQDHLHALLDKIRDRLWYIRWGIRILVPFTLLLISYCFTGIGMTLCLKQERRWQRWNPICGEFDIVNPYLAGAIIFAVGLLFFYGLLVWQLVAEVDFDFQKKWWQFWKKGADESSDPASSGSNSAASPGSDRQ